MRLKDYLHFKEIDITEFAKMVGSSRPHMNLIVREKRRPSIKLAQKIQKITNGEVTAMELLRINDKDEECSL